MQPDRYVVVGNPVNHSLSPDIHAQFAAQLGDDIDYQKVEVAVGGFAAFVKEFAAQGGQGLNVTVPFKEDAYRYCDHLDAAASAAGAVNTIALRGALAYGHNTDGLGLVTDLTQRHGRDLEGCSILILGAGGATRGVLAPLLAQSPSRVLIVNRTAQRALDLAGGFAQAAQRSGADLRGMGFAELELEQVPVDLIINATSVGLAGATVPLAERWLHNAFCYDMGYGANAGFHHWAQQHGAPLSVDGLGMLVEQAAAAFSIWRGKVVDTEPVYQALRMTLAGQAG